jgi:DHA1 family putative efflux transporter-like MFS transporter
VTGQIATAYSAINIIFSLIIGVLSTRYRPKTLLIVGLMLYIVSALGCFISTSFLILVISYSLTGISVSIVTPMTATIIGDVLAPDRRSSALGWAGAGTPFSVLLGSPMVSYIVGQHGWRSVFIFFMLPVSAIGLALAYFWIPKSMGRYDLKPGSASGGYKKIFSNKSAIACLIGAIFVSINISNILTYCVSSFRERFQVSAEFASIIFSAQAVTAFSGTILGGNLANKLGRKRLVVLASLLLGMLTMGTFNIGVFWLSAAVSIVLWIFGSSASIVGRSLSLEQENEFRGTMMSAHSAAVGVGSTLGAMIGGLILLRYDYSELGYIIGAFGTISMLVYHFFSEEPTD